MLVRLFIVVLTLVGPMPFRICTCAATQTLDNESSACPGIHQQGIHEHESEVVEDHDATHTHNTCPVGTPYHPDRHSSDCPVVNPCASIVAAISAPNVDLSTEYDADLPSCDEPPCPRPSFLPRRTERRFSSISVPFYISQVSFQI